MNGRFFLDTNIFVYSFDSDAPAKAHRARQLIRQAIATRKGIISFQVAQEFFNVALQHFRTPMSFSEAHQYLTTVFRPLLAVHSTLGLYGDALQLKERYRFSWCDALIVAAAIEAQCDILYSEDLRHGQRIGDMQVENPFL